MLESERMRRDIMAPLGRMFYGIDLFSPVVWVQLSCIGVLLYNLAWSVDDIWGTLIPMEYIDA
jgi:hypothetical protein